MIKIIRQPLSIIHHATGCAHLNLVCVVCLSCLEVPQLCVLVLLLLSSTFLLVEIVVAVVIVTFILTTYIH